MIGRRALLTTAAAVVGAGAAGAAGWELAPYRLKERLGLTPEPFVPDAAEGQVRLETVRSAAMGGSVDLFTAVPAGHGDGAGLPVVVVLHGASASAAALRGFGLGRFVTAAVERGTPPFVLAGTDDGPAGWVTGGGADPQSMLLRELPARLAERGFDAGRRALWGWSRGGYGALRFALARPTWARGVALFSPAVQPGDAVLDDLGGLTPARLALWCGTEDPFVEGSRRLVAALPARPGLVTFAPGGHTRAFWNAHTLDAFDWLARRL